MWSNLEILSFDVFTFNSVTNEPDVLGNKLQT